MSRTSSLDTSTVVISPAERSLHCVRCLWLSQSAQPFGALKSHRPTLTDEPPRVRSTYADSKKKTWEKKFSRGCWPENLAAFENKLLLFSFFIDVLTLIYWLPGHSAVDSVAKWFICDFRRFLRCDWIQQAEEFSCARILPLEILER